MMDKKVLGDYNWPLFITVFIISAFGALMVGSATIFPEGDVSFVTLFSSGFFVRQLVWVVGGLAAMFVLSLIDYGDWRRYFIPIYILSLGLLVLVIFVGIDINNAQRWLYLGFFNLQPSEVAKVAIIICIAALMTKEGKKLDSWGDLVIPFGVILPPMALVLLQPDLGTSLIFIVITAAILFVAGMRWMHILVLGGAGIVSGALAFLFFLTPYQRTRIIMFTDPYQDYFGDGWHTIQSTIAVGSGQFSGKGLFQGSQTRFFLPEQQTDFIFSVIGEQLGFVGAACVVLMYLLLILQILKVGMNAKDNFGRYICVGVAAMLSFQLLVNVGMTIGIMPVTGIPLPLISYGGSSFLTTMIALGLVLSVSCHKDTSIF